jgi:hypothetical protein
MGYPENILSVERNAKKILVKLAQSFVEEILINSDKNK